MRIGQRSDSKSDAQQWVEGSNPLPSAYVMVMTGLFRSDRRHCPVVGLSYLFVSSGGE